MGDADTSNGEDTDASGQLEIQLAWDPNTEDDLASYELIYHTEPDVCNADGATHTFVAATSTTTIIEGLQTDRTYYFALRAVDEAGNKSVDCSNEVSAKTGGG